MSVMPRFLWPLIETAARNEIPNLVEQNFMPSADVNHYVLSWAAAALLERDLDNAIAKLETAHFAWRLSQGQKLPPRYTIPDGVKSRLCGCGRKIYFVPSKRGKPVPVTSSGYSHFASCPDAKQHSKARTAPAVQAVAEGNAPPKEAT